MPNYRLHLINAHIDCDDAEGQDLPSLDEARAKAIEGIRGVLGDELSHGTLDLRGRVIIEDARGAVLMTIPFAEAVSIRLPDGNLVAD